jgi:hypothetical protein
MARRVSALCPSPAHCSKEASHQKGTVYPIGKRVKMWYGQYMVYRKDQQGKEVRRQRNVALCPKANTPKWKAEQMLQEIILKETKGVGPTPTLPPDDGSGANFFRMSDG